MLPTRIALGLPAHRPGRDQVTVVDLDSRRLPAADATHRVLDAIADAPADALLFLKIDSLLRGHLGTDLELLARTGPVVMASAVPALGRVVRGGVVHADGRLPIDTFTATELTRAGLIRLDLISSTAPPAVR